jgi:hypothetical protein
MGNLSYRVMKTHDSGKAVYYSVACDCLDNDHQLDLEIEVDDFPIMTLHFYGKMDLPVYWGCTNIASMAWVRVKTAFKILLTGWVDIQNEFILREEAHIDSFIAALEEGKKRVRAHELKREVQ